MNNIYSGSRTCRDHDPEVPLLVYGTGRKAYMRVLLYALFHDGIRKEGANAPLGHLEALRSNQKF